MNEEQAARIHEFVRLSRSLYPGRRDTQGAYRALGEMVCAQHCPGCGRWASVEHGDTAEWWWIITNCAKCGRWETTEAPLGELFGKRRAKTRKLEES